MMTGNIEKSSRGCANLRQEVMKNVRSLLISAKYGLTVAELQRDYNDMIKKPLPFRELGYKTPVDMLKDMPNVARPTWEKGVLILKGIADASTRHIANLVERQKRTSPKRKTRLTTYRPESAPVVPHFVRTQIKELLSNYPSGLLGSMFAIAFSRRFGKELNYNALRFHSLGHLLESIPDIARVEDMRGGGLRVYGKGIAINSVVNMEDPGDNFPTTRRTESSSTSVQTTTERKNGKPVPNLDSRCEGNKTVGTNSSMKLKVAGRSGIDEEIQEECKQVLAKRPNGIWAARFAAEYKKFHKKELNIKQLGFMSMVEFMSAMPDVVRIERPTKLDWLLFLAKDENHDHQKSNGEVSVAKEIPKDSVSPVPSVAGNTLNIPDSVGRGTYFSKIKPPECGYIEVCVTHVIDPHHFWVMMIENWPKLQALSEEIRQFYSSRESSTYRMPYWFVSVGQACCALYDDGSWYRGLVAGINSEESIEVFYVDYGNSARLPLSSLRVLRSQFIKLPAQALPSKLAYIEPFDGGKEWSAGATHRFYHLTKNYRNLVGLVCGVKEDVLSLCLCDTNANEDLHINDELVAEKYAICPEISSPAEASSPTGQDHDRNSVGQQRQEVLMQNVPMQLTLEQQFYLSQHAINVQSMLRDLPAYPQYIRSWVNQTAQYANSFVNSQVNERSLASIPGDALCNDDLNFVEEINQELELDLPSSERVIKRINLANDYAFHVIKFGERPYLISAEISTLFWDSDLLRPMLRQKKKTVTKSVVSYSENRELFDVLIRCNIAGVTDGDEPRSSVTLYDLEGVPEILKTFDHPSEELLSEFLAEIDCFKKEGENYWHEKKEDVQLKLGSEAASSSEDQLSESELIGIDELQLLLQAMQFRRKRILQGLMTGGHCTDSTGGTVDELKEVEMQIEGLRLEILTKEQTL
ncbi:tudor domain-containing protein 5-like isoform X1 [Acropora millepora]|uniref:tudor domain-containing protein 5-like isoform X1 n=1 Tax=Acropora millepora TaxID=45264 RepID=UPI001CF2B12C|nr:tudor domain-containing protein 5-like isoform X1 [Acropora millepora]